MYRLMSSSLLVPCMSDLAQKYSVNQFCFDLTYRLSWFASVNLTCGWISSQLHSPNVFSGRRISWEECEQLVHTIDYDVGVPQHVNASISQCCLNALMRDHTSVWGS